MGMNEPKRKVKYSIDPNALNWANDESKFGKRLMEKLGWESGKGLGAKGTGITENIKIHYKDDSKGVGYKKDYDSVWLVHQDNFDDLLSQLKQSNEDTADTAVIANEKVHKSLEEASKNSRARVHYRKFTKSKDLTNATKMDLDCILGRHKRDKAKELKKQELDDKMGNKCESSEESSSSQEEAKDQVQSSFKTITNKLSMNEYFASKMALLRQRQTEQPVDRSSDDDVDDRPQFRQYPAYEIPQFQQDDEVDVKTNLVEVDEMECVVEVKEKRKKKKSREAEQPIEEEEEAVEKIEVEIDDGSKKKKRKKKSREEEEPEPEPIVVEQDETVECLNKKKKKKKRSKEEDVPSNDAVIVEVQTNCVAVTNGNSAKNGHLTRYDIENPFNGANLIKLNGYTPYVVTTNIQELLDDKEKISRRKISKFNKVIADNPDAYNSLKKPAINLNKE